MSRSALLYFSLCGIITASVWYWYNNDKENGKVEECHAPFLNETKTEKAILKKLLSSNNRIVSSPFLISRTWSILRRKLNFHIDKLCSEATGQCFNIIDTYEMQSDRLFAYRGLRSVGNGSVLLLSAARLLPPRPINWENFNSKGWKVYKKSVKLNYARMMIAGSFFSGALDYDCKDVQNILMIGLGGGIINNYFSSMDRLQLNITVVDNDPVMKKIAEKWYELKTTPMQRIVVDDGLRFIREANTKGEIYDVLLIDVCYNEHRDLMAPIEEFMVGDEIEQMNKMLKPDGAVIVNIVTRPEKVDEADRVHFIYSRHFPSCYFMHFGKYDKMLFCSKKEKNSWLDNADELRERFKRIDKELGFDLTGNKGDENQKKITQDV